MKMKKNYLFITLIPLLLAGCSNAEESKKYPAINDQQTIMKDYYRQHTSNQSYLNLYELKTTFEYDPTYDVFGALAPIDSAKNLYYEAALTNNVGVYSGYFICNNKVSTYVGDKANVGSISEYEQNESFWFRPFDSGHEGKMELIHRQEVKDNDLDKVTKDSHTEIEVEQDNISHYFSNNINTDYSSYFERPLVQPTSSTTRQVSAYQKTEIEIVETYNETIEAEQIQNPIHPSEEYKLTVMKQTTGQTNFKNIEKIGWVGTSFIETITYCLISDYELKLLNEPRLIYKEETTIDFTYASTMQPYTGEAYVFQQEDEKIELYRPSMFVYESGSFNKLSEACIDVSKEYKKVHPEFSGYAYSFSAVSLEQNKLYSFACHEDIENGLYETIGYNQLASKAGGTIISGGVEGHNLIKTITTSETYEFIILVSSNGTKSLIAQLHG